MTSFNEPAAAKTAEREAELPEALWNLLRTHERTEKQDIDFLFEQLAKADDERAAAASFRLQLWTTATQEGWEAGATWQREQSTAAKPIPSNPDLPKLLRSMGGGTVAIQLGHDIILNAAADEIDARREQSALSGGEREEVLRQIKTTIDAVLEAQRWCDAKAHYNLIATELQIARIHLSALAARLRSASSEALPLDYYGLTLEDVKRAVVAFWKPTNPSYEPDKHCMAHMADALHAAFAGRKRAAPSPAPEPFEYPEFPYQSTAPEQRAETALERVADAIDEARYKHPDHSRERPRPLSEAYETDREYAFRLARAALSALPHPAPTADTSQRPAREMSLLAIYNEQNELGRQWADLQEQLKESGGHSGSPGEWIAERLDELDAEWQRRSDAQRNAPAPAADAVAVPREWLKKWDGRFINSDIDREYRAEITRLLGETP